MSPQKISNTVKLVIGVLILGVLYWIFCWFDDMTGGDE